MIRGVDGVARVDFVRFQDVAMPGSGLPLTVIARPITRTSADGVLPIRRRDHAAGARRARCRCGRRRRRSTCAASTSARCSTCRSAAQAVRASVRGLWRDYERPGGSVVMPRDVFVRYTGDTRATTAALWLRAGADPDAVAARIQAALQRGGDYEIAVPREIRRLSLRVFDRTFAVTYLLEAVAVLIGLFGISASTSSQVLARRGEFGMLRHLGVTRGEIGRMLAVEGAALGAVGVVDGPRRWAASSA